MSKCGYCGAEGMDHDHEHLARECYPIQIKAKDAEIDCLRKHLRNLIDVYDYCSYDPADRGYSPLSNAMEEARSLLPSGLSYSEYAEVFCTGHIEP